MKSQESASHRLYRFWSSIRKSFRRDGRVIEAAMQDEEEIDHRVHWPSALEERLKELLDRKDLSASGIASRLGVTRNAVIGKTHRMKMTISRAKPATPAVARVRVRWPAAKQRPLPHVVAPAPIELAPLGLRIEQLESGVCRYPYGDYPPYLYCGQPTKPDSPYCAFHHRICRIPVSR